MREKYFFDIPVYRLAKEEYYKKLDSYVEAKMYQGPPSHVELMKEFHEQHPDQKQLHEQHLRKNYGGAWNYNEIIGWIQLHFLGNQIRGEFWRVKAKRIIRTRKKEFEYITWKLAPEIDIPHEASNTEILNLIKEYLSRCQEELKKGRYIETSRFDVIAPYVDWRSL
ncbi:MAG: hypothetical protein OEL87_03610 [Nanoarchaeota archaeon]|nr:hypothetical protein [Nanoarchaeota archaeon]